MPAESLVTRYKQLLQKLLPPGVAMNRRDDSALASWLESFAVEFARVDEDALTAYVESYPGDATDAELLTDWETLVGLPDACTAFLTTEEQRRAAVLLRFAIDKGQSEADFRSIASDLGYTVNVGLYDTWRCGAARCGHTPIQGEPWQFASRMSYEVADPADTEADASLECQLSAHKHAHTHINFSGWDANTALSGLSNLSNHFVHGEMITHDVGGLDIIDSWTNRSTSNDWIQSGIPDIGTMYVSTRDTWSGADCGDEGGSRSLVGLSIDVAADAGSLAQHGAFNIWLAFDIHSFSGTTRTIFSSSDLNILLEETGGVALFRVIYDGAILLTPAAVGTTNVLALAAGSGLVYAIGNAGTQVNDTLTGGPYADDSVSIGGIADISFLELISTSDFQGQPIVDAGAIAVTSYLTDKYGIT